MPTLAEALKDGEEAQEDPPSPFDVEQIMKGPAVKKFVSTAKRVSVPKLLAANKAVVDVSPFHMMNGKPASLDHAKKAWASDHAKKASKKGFSHRMKKLVAKKKLSV